MTSTESITVSLEWAKKLKEAGYPQKDSYLHWQWYEADGEWPGFYEQSRWDCYHMEASYEDYDDDEVYAAPTAEEILRSLPSYFDQEGMRFYLITQKDDNDDSWTACYSCGTCMIMRGVGPMRIECVGLANTAAKMWLFLRDNNLLPSA